MPRKSTAKAKRGGLVIVNIHDKAQVRKAERRLLQHAAGAGKETAAEKKRRQALSQWEELLAVTNAGDLKKLVGSAKARDALMFDAQAGDARLAGILLNAGVKPDVEMYHMRPTARERILRET